MVFIGENLQISSPRSAARYGCFCLSSVVFEVPANDVCKDRKGTHVPLREAKTQNQRNILIWKTIVKGAREIVQWLFAVVALSEDWGSNPSFQMATYNYLNLYFQGIWCPLLTMIDAKYACSTHTYMLAKHSYT